MARCSFLSSVSLTLCLAGCSPESPATRGPLTLRPANGTEAAPLETSVLRLVPGSSESNWEATAEVVERVELDDGPGLRVQGGEAQEIALHGDFDVAQFNLVWVEVLAVEDVSLRLGVEGSGEAPIRSGSLDVRFLLAGTRQRVAFDLRGLPADLTRARTLRVLGRGQGPDWTLLSVELAQRAARAWLPGGSNPVDLVSLHGDARRAQALASEVPLTAEVKIPSAGQLRFSFARAPRHATPGPRTFLRVSAGTRELTRVQPPGGWSAEGWQSVVLDLAEFGNEELSLGFALTADEPGPLPGAMIVLGEPILAEPVKSPPTVLLVTSDTHRADHIATAPGSAAVHTPALDALAQKGVLFSNCFATSNITLPSHSALLTGMHPRDTGITNNRTRLGAQADTLAERFRAAGFTTLAVTSAKHMNHDWSGLGQGFDRMAWPVDQRDRSAPDSIAQLREWMEEYADRPLFIWLHLYDAHRPYEPPESEAERYYPADQDPRSDTWPSPAGPLPPFLKGVRDLDYVRALYKGEVSHLDAELGALLASDRLADAFVAGTGDHGESLGEQGLWWDHVSVYPSVLHVPLILSWPAGPTGLRVDVPVQHLGLGRTLLELAGVPAADYPGTDLRRFLDETPPTEPRFAWGEDAHALSVTHDGWHLVLHLHVDCIKPDLMTTDLLAEHALELFDLGADPDCTTDLSRVEPDRTGQLGGLLLRWLEGAERNLAEVQHMDAAGLEMLAALGYGGRVEDGATAEVDLEHVRSLLAPFLPE